MQEANKFDNVIKLTEILKSYRKVYKDLEGKRRKSQTIVRKVKPIH